MAIPASYRELDVLLPPRLAVETVWTSLSDKITDALILPDGRADLILRFMLDDDDRPYDIIPIIAGPSADYWFSPAIPCRGFVGLRFKPGFGGYFLGVDLAGIAGRAYSGDEALALAPQLVALCQPATDVESLIIRMEQFFDDYAEPQISAILVRVMNDMHLSGGRAAIKDLARDNGVTVRGLHRLFVKFVGLSPKAFAAVLRFHRALRLLTRAGLSLSHAALEAGYADQAHMTRDFKRHGGFTPAAIPPNLVMVGLPL
ncbi:MAG: AraC family transcriptional regulator [Alphaproteobacteria bacterium]|nr:AraC family transcriptional regulator [Alphaproteobacteria bacterium]